MKNKNKIWSNQKNAIIWPKPIRVWGKKKKKWKKKRKSKIHDS